MSAFRLEVTLFDDLLSAFRQDVLVKRYARWEDVLDYSRRSANPVGRLVLRISGYRDPRCDDWSDAVCTALQLTNFWQDVERDWQKGRIYVPEAFIQAAGADERDLGRRRMTPEWRHALGDAARRTRDLFTAGRPIADAVRGRLRYELRATWLGGVRILDRLEAAGFDVFHRRPTLGWGDAIPIGWNLIAWRRSHPRQ
jgi:squalene synthase HpnC